MPVTQRIYGALRSGIRDGRVPSGSRLDEGSLGRMLSAPRDAVRVALQRLRDDHLVERAPRRGTVVMRGPSRVDVGQLFRVRDLDSTMAVLEITTCPTPPGLFDDESLGTEVVVVERLLRHGDSLCFEITFSRAIDTGLHTRLSAMHSQDRPRRQASRRVLHRGVAKHTRQSGHHGGSGRERPAIGRAHPHQRGEGGLSFRATSIRLHRDACRSVTRVLPGECELPRIHGVTPHGG